LLEELEYAVESPLRARFGVEIILYCHQRYAFPARALKEVIRWKSQMAAHNTNEPVARVMPIHWLEGLVLQTIRTSNHVIGLSSLWRPYEGQESVPPLSGNKAPS
jgi:hypothetical protein